jgi:hypothetical protein
MWNGKVARMPIMILFGISRGVEIIVNLVNRLQ